MPGAVYLEGEGVVLRTIEEDDLPFLRDAINDPAVRRYLPSRLPLNLDGEREYYEEVVVGDEEALNLLVWAATGEGGEERRAGTVGLHGLGSVDGSAEIGLFLVPEHWGAGVGTEASRLVVDWAFAERRLHRVVARVLDGNEASARIWEKLGFRREATFREAAFHDGRHVDQHLYAVLAHEWSDGAD